MVGPPMFWLVSRRRGPLTYDALYTTLRRRAERRGFHLHPHILRSTGAIRWRQKGGSVASLLTMAGWSSLEMAQRYVRAAENRLAVEEAHRLGQHSQLPPCGPETSKASLDEWPAGTMIGSLVREFSDDPGGDSGGDEPGGAGA